MNINKFFLSAFISSSFLITSCDNSNIIKEMECTFTFRFKSKYEVGEAFSTSGIIVKDKSSKEELKNYTFSIDEGYVFEEPNEDFKITISKENYLNYEFSVCVVGESIQEEENKKTLSFFNLNDFHGSFKQNISTSEMGMSSIGQFLLNQKKKNPNAFITSSGDMWQGGIESNKTKGNIITDAMNIIGFDAMSIGNHEFDWDEDAIIKNVEMMNFPFLNSNIFYADSNLRPNYFTPSTLIERNNIKVGFIGTISKSCEDDILYSVVKKFKFEYPREYYINESNKLRENGADIIVILAHDGNETTYEDATNISPTYNKPYADLVFLGHDHREKSDTFNNVPLVEAYSNGKSIANINLNIEKIENSWKVVSHEVMFHNLNTTVSETLSNSDINSLLDKYYEVIGDVNRVICTFKNTYDRYGFINIVNQAIIDYINGEKSLSDVKVTAAVHNYSGIRVNEVKKGDFTYQDLIKACPFSNNIYAMKVNKVQYEDLLNKHPYYEAVDFDSSLGYAWVGTISYVSEPLLDSLLDYRSFPLYIYEIMEDYLIEHNGEF